MRFWTYLVLLHLGVVDLTLASCFPYPPHQALLIDAQDFQHIRTGVYCGTAINLSSKEERNLSLFIEKWCAIKKVPEWIPIFSVVEEQFYSLLAVLNRYSKSLYSHWVSLLSLKKSAVARDDFLPAVTCNGDESIGGVHNRIVGYTART